MARRARARDDDFKIDFAKHSEKVSAAIESDERYWRENDAKFRAVNQKVGSYEEFRDIVKAAHLKPLEKGDRMSDMAKFTQEWNVCAKKVSDQDMTPEARLEEKELTVPKTSLEFARDWKRLTNPDKKLSYLRNIDSDRLRRLFQKDSGIDLASEILVLLSRSTDSNSVEWTLQFLEILPECDRFALTLQFMSREEKECCENLFKTLSGISDLEKEKLNELRQKYCLRPVDDLT